MWMLLECYRNSMLEPTAGPQMTHRWLLPSHDCVNIQEPGLETDRSRSPNLFLYGWMLEHKEEMGIENERERTSSMLDCKHNVLHKAILLKMEKEIINL